ncbi:alpha/beta fold hydrolase [Kineococcus gynurae]|uniref:Alpha/beta fold hydrolase n=1 Tax=Kineococcus gynurae TaxID=452979 RepID=A0ABV5LNX2_9ACTN
MTSTPARVVVVHGYGANPRSHWFDWLRAELAPLAEVRVVELPDSGSPDATAWDEAVAATVGEPDERTVLVGHSLGSITAARYLAARPAEAEVAGLVLLAGFADPLPEIPELDGFVGAGLTGALGGLARARARGRIVVIRSDDDPVVPPAASDVLAERLAAPVRVVPGGRHFLDREGFTELPIVAEEVRALLAATPLPATSRRVADALAAAGISTAVRWLDASARTAAEAAASLGVPVGAIANSLVFTTDAGPLLVLTSGRHRVDLDLLAAGAGVTGLRRATPAEVRAATGQAIGGVAPVGHPAPVRTLLDTALREHRIVWAAAGTPHSVFPTSVEELLRLTDAAEVAVATR